MDEARDGVRGNSIAPGVIQTPLQQSFIASQADPQACRDLIESWQWQGRAGSPEDVGYAALFLASDQAGFITGVELILSGGAAKVGRRIAVGRVPRRWQAVEEVLGAFGQQVRAARRRYRQFVAAGHPVACRAR